MGWVVGIGGLAVAALDEQITAYQALIYTSDTLAGTALTYIAVSGEPTTDADRSALWALLNCEPWPDWATAVRVHGPFLPGSVLDLAGHFNKAVLAVAKPEALTVI